MRSAVAPVLARLALWAMAGAAALPAAAQQDVELYDQNDFRGNRLTLSEAAPDLAAYGVGGRVGSVVVHRGQWEFCTQPRFGGACITVGPGRYAQLPPALRGSVASLRPGGKGPPPVPPRPGTPDRGPATVTLFNGEFAGERLTFSEAVSDLRPHMFNDAAVSIQITGSLDWELCSDGGFGGQCQRFPPGRHLLGPSMYGRVSSLRPAGGGSPVTPVTPVPPTAGGASVVLYEHRDGGRRLDVTAALANLGEHGFNDIASSIEVRRGRWQLCAHAGYGEPCQVFGPGRHLLPAGLEDRVSSLRPVFGQRDEPVGAAGAVTLHERHDLSGRSVLLAEATANLRAQGFNDRARSIEVHGGRWELCSDADFSGQCRLYGPGVHALPDGLAGRLTSLRPR